MYTKTCLSCKKKFESLRDTEKYCSNKCNTYHHREVSTTAKKVSTTDNITVSVTKLTRDELYENIGAYQGDGWVDSPEHIELLRRLENWTQSQLKGYWMPNRITQKFA